jgi:carbamoyltransferase
MLYSNTVRDDKIEEIAAITHVDKSCRIQTVTTEYNERMTILINEFYKLSGTPVVLNTSFNDNGQPIVESPVDALNAFTNMDIDLLVIGNFLVTKNKV